MAVRRRLLSDWTLSYLGRELPATVPGCVHTDLIAAGELRDIRVDGTEAEMDWIGNTDFTYRTEILEIPVGQSVLKFHGLDTLADIYLNGELVLQTKNMHRSYEIALAQFTVPLKIELRFHAPLPEMIRLEKERGPLPNPYNRPYNILRKMACSYGWDWGPITLTSGIWRPVEILTYEYERIIDVQLIPDFDHGGVLKVLPQTEGIETLTLTVNDQSHSIIPNQLNEIKLEGVRPWYPRGYGDQPLYEVKISSNNDSWSATVGFRSLAALNQISGDRREFGVAVNGERIWLKGVNWIPDDPFPSRISEAQYRAKIANLKDLGVNAIRVWGGGIYESDLFYQICDQEGFLVWQDFLFACAVYSQDPETLEEVEQEARENIIRLSKYASLFMWCGNNECLEGHQNWGWEDQLQGRPWGAYYYFTLLPALMQELDPSRLYIPGSPFAVDSEDVMSELSGTNHIWDVWNRRRYQGYESYSPSLAAEFGYNGPASWPTLTTALHGDDIDPTNPLVREHQKAFKGMENIENGLNWEFAEAPTTGPLWYFGSQLVQARAVETGVKHFRTLYATCSGSFLWQFNDMWPALSWAIYDSDSQRKLAWYSLKNAYSELVPHLDGTSRTLKILNEGVAQNARVTVRSITATGDIRVELDLNVHLPARDVFIQSLPQEPEPGHYIVVDCGDIRISRYSLDVSIPVLPPAQYKSAVTQRGSVVEVAIHSENLIVDFTILPEFVIKNFTVNKNRVTMLPGEDLTLIIRCASEGDAITLTESKVKWMYSQNDLAL
jgi:beta-mannosidase